MSLNVYSSDLHRYLMSTDVTFFKGWSFLTSYYELLDISKVLPVPSFAASAIVYPSSPPYTTPSSSTLRPPLLTYGRHLCFSYDPNNSRPPQSPYLLWTRLHKVLSLPLEKVFDLIVTPSSLLLL